jgi:hypothetical protein
MLGYLKNSRRFWNKEKKWKKYPSVTSPRPLHTFVKPIVPSALESSENGESVACFVDELNDMLGWRKTLPTLGHVYSWWCLWYVYFLILCIQFSLKLCCFSKVSPYKSVVMCENVVDAAQMLLLIFRHWILILMPLFLLEDNFIWEQEEIQTPYCISWRFSGHYWAKAWNYVPGVWLYWGN